MTDTLDFRRHLRSGSAYILLAGAATVAVFLLSQAAGPDAAHNLPSPTPVSLADVAFPLASPNPIGSGGLAADGDSDIDQAQLQQQINQQQMLQAEQQAEEQNELAQQQALQDELQAQQTEIQASQ